MISEIMCVFWREKGACGTTMGVKELICFKRRVFWTDLGSIWDRFWTDFGSIWDGFGIDFGLYINIYIYPLY